MIKQKLEELGHFVTPPNGWNDASSESLIQHLDNKLYTDWKAGMIRKNSEMVKASEAVLILNLSADGKENYVGGSTFLEAYETFMQGKKLFLYNPIPDGPLRDELLGFSPVILNGDLSLLI